jgi:hypothetical protein
LSGSRAWDKVLLVCTSSETFLGLGVFTGEDLAFRFVVLTTCHAGLSVGLGVLREDDVAAAASLDRAVVGVDAGHVYIDVSCRSAD